MANLATVINNRLNMIEDYYISNSEFTEKFIQKFIDDNLVNFSLEKIF
jgi:hypothetical protein